MAHMANITYSDGDGDDDDGDDDVFIGAGRASEMPMDSIWDGGTWTGSLIWDSAVRLSELFLDNHEWRSEFVSRLQERTSNRTPAMTVLELGCGLGLPSYNYNACDGAHASDRHEGDSHRQSMDCGHCRGRRADDGRKT